MSALKQMPPVRRRAVQAGGRDWVRTEEPASGAALPLTVLPAVDGIVLPAWAAANRGWLEAALLERGALLFRGFDVPSVAMFEAFLAAVSDQGMDYRERSSPRSRVGDHTFTSTDYPADQPILLHNENSYAYTWPRKIAFFCETPALRGGQTPLADCRRVLAAIPPEARARAEAEGILYLRGFGDGFGLSWQVSFQTEDRAAVEAYCRSAGIEVEWCAGGRLRTRARRPAVIRHPATGEALWFNQGALFHVSSLEAGVREALLREFGEEDLPQHARYGDGSPIPPEVVSTWLEAYRRETVPVEWRAGDVLLLDNMLVAHGRAPFEGPRRVVVGMADSQSWDDV